MTVADGVALHVNRWAGPGVPFLLVHGLASNARMWDGVAGVLADRGHAVAAVDLRGHGQSDKPDSGYSFERVVADLGAVIDSLGFDRPVAVGQSWGANVVLELGARHPELVRGVAGVDGATIELADRFDSWEACAAALAPPALTGLARVEVEAMLRARHPDWPEAGVHGMLANFEVRADGTVAPWLTRDRHMLILRALYEHRPSTRYPSLKVPVLLIPARAGDVAFPSAARVRPINGDHDLHAQHPDRVAGLLLDALADGFFA